MKSGFRSLLRVLLATVLVIAGFWILKTSLRGYKLHDILGEFQLIPLRSILYAGLFTLINYFVMTFYDFLAFRFIRRPLPYSGVMMPAFIGYSFSQSLGFPLLMGGSVRYRFYSARGISLPEIAKVIAFSAVTFWIGIFTVGGLALVVNPISIQSASYIHPQYLRVLGGFLIACGTAYVLYSVLQKHPVRIRNVEFQAAGWLSVWQIVISSVDWVLAGIVLYILLPRSAEISFTKFLVTFLAAQILGLFSHIPGGIGVFESMILLLLSPHAPAVEIAGSLIAYRGIYYLFPLCISAILFAAHEIAYHRKFIRRISRTASRWMLRLAPSLFAFSVFGAGMILIFSGATPSLQPRLHWLQRYLPLLFLEFSHLLGSLTGVGLLLLAWGLYRKLDAAYLLSVALLATGFAASLLKGFDYEEAVLMAVLLVALLPCRRFFYRKTSFTSERFTWPWAVAVGLVLISSVWLVFFSYKHIPYSHELWWRFTVSGDAPRSLRAMVGVFGIVFLFSFRKLLSPAAPEPYPPSEVDLQKVRSIIGNSAPSSGNLALLGDKALMFHSGGNAFLMYAVEGRSWIAMGDPIGPEKEQADLAWRFREVVDAHNGWTVFYEVGKQTLPLYLDLGLTLMKLGEEARIPLAEFNMDGASRKTFRHLLNKFHRDGYTFEIIPAEQVPSILPELQNISDEWLLGKNTREKGFSLGAFKIDYVRQFPAGIVRSGDGTRLAFVNIWSAGNREELSLDLMRFLPNAPPGVMDFLFLSLILWGKQENYRWFNLGMAPLSGLPNKMLAPFWSRIGSLIFQHGEQMYNFQGLRLYKEKFDPVWEPKYLASPGGLALPRILANLATLVSGSLRGVVSK